MVRVKAFKGTNKHTTTLYAKLNPEFTYIPPQLKHIKHSFCSIEERGRERPTVTRVETQLNLGDVLSLLIKDFDQSMKALIQNAIDLLKLNAGHQAIFWSALKEDENPKAKAIQSMFTLRDLLCSIDEQQSFQRTITNTDGTEDLTAEQIMLFETEVLIG